MKFMSFAITPFLNIAAKESEVIKWAGKEDKKYSKHLNIHLLLLEVL